MSYSHYLPRDVSPIDVRTFSSDAININPLPILAANKTLYSEISRACEEYRVTSLDDFLETRKVIQV
jgi:hypothetical protein